MEITAEQLHNLNATATPLAPRAAVATLITIAVAATILLPGSPLGLAIVSLALIGSMVVWWKYLRGTGERINNYDPLKTDEEVQRSAIDWKEEGRLIVLFVIIFGFINLGPIVQNAPAFAVPIAIVSFFASMWALSKKQLRPPYYKTPEQLFADNPAFSVGRDAEGIIACLHALRIVPGGLQMHNTEFLKLLNKELQWPQAESERALKKAIGSGRVVSIRELRLRDDAITWLTLSPKSLTAFQQSVIAD